MYSNRLKMKLLQKEGPINLTETTPYYVSEIGAAHRVVH
jgi:hypothetical protein